MTVNSSSYPFDTVVRITDTIGNERIQGSGVLISPDEVLTASHVVYSTGVGTANDIVVTPGYNDGSAPFGSAYGTYIHYNAIDDAGDQISNYDFAVRLRCDPLVVRIHVDWHYGAVGEFPGGTSHHRRLSGLGERGDGGEFADSFR